MNRPSYKELLFDECKDRDEQLQWIRNAVNGEAEFCNRGFPYSEEEELAREIMQLHTRIAELEEKQRWIPVSERLPETDGQYIGYTNTGLVDTHWLVDGHFLVTYSCEHNWLTTPTSWILESASGGNVYVTHWMPLPEPPIVYGKERER